MVGGGLAGAAMAWQGHFRGWKVAIVDASTTSSCSKVAAGLVTPITGTRSAASWEWERFYPACDLHYREVEKQTACTFWYPAPAIRIYASEEERQRAVERWQSNPREPAASDSFENRPRMRAVGEEWISECAAPFGAAWMEPAGRLDTRAYLAATHRSFQQRGSFFELNLDIEKDIAIEQGASQGERFQSEIVLAPESFRVESLGIRAAAVALCQGFAGLRSSWFPDLPMHPARGDILTLSIPNGPHFPHVLHGDAWVVPLAPGVYRVGATYDRHLLDDKVDDRPAVMEARRLLMDRWRAAWVSPGMQEVEMVDHQAAVRPASYDRHPLIGCHPEHERLMLLNGLGSKGTLMAPLLASDLCEAVERGKALDPRLLWSRRGKPTPRS